MAILTDSEVRWLETKAMPAFGVRKLKIEWSDSQARYPDIWTDGEHTVTVTREWKGQAPRERKKRLVHELIHIGWGLDHDEGIGYNSRPDEDRYSWRVMRELRL